jgi:hypothetical protein
LYFNLKNLFADSSRNIIQTSQNQSTQIPPSNFGQHQAPRNLGSSALSSVLNGVTQFAQHCKIFLFLK